MSVTRRPSNGWRIRFVVKGLGVGGTETHLSQILPFLVQQGYEVTVLMLTPTVAGDFSARLAAAGVNVLGFPAWLQLRACPKILAKGIRCVSNIIRLCRHFSGDKPTLTHFFLPEPYLLGMLSAKLMRIKAPLVMSRRCLNNYQQQHFLLTRLERYFHRHCSVILANSQAILRQLAEHEGVPMNKLRLIYNGVAKPDLNHHSNNQSSVEVYTIVVVANLIAYKGHVDLMQALAIVNKTVGVKWQLWVIGRDDGMLTQLKAQATSLKLTQQIIWMNQCKDISTSLACARLAILPSHQEGFSNAVLEYMAYKVPTIVSMVGGNREAILHRYNGLVVPAHSPNELATAILYMIHHPSAAQRFAERSYQLIEHQFSQAKMLNAYHRLYQDLLMNDQHVSVVK